MKPKRDELAEVLNELEQAEEPSLRKRKISTFDSLFESRGGNGYTGYNVDECVRAGYSREECEKCFAGKAGRG